MEKVHGIMRLTDTSLLYKSIMVPLISTAETRTQKEWREICCRYNIDITFRMECMSRSREPDNTWRTREFHYKITNRKQLQQNNWLTTTLTREGLLRDSDTHARGTSTRSLCFSDYLKWFQNDSICIWEHNTYEMPTEINKRDSIKVMPAVFHIINMHFSNKFNIKSYWIEHTV